MLMNHRLILLVSVACFFAMTSSGLGQSTATHTTRWYGTMEAPGRDFRFRIEATDSKDATDTTTAPQLVSLDEGGQKFALSNYSESAHDLSFDLPATKASFKGSINDQGIVNGAWKQSGADIPLRFQRIPWGIHLPPTEHWKGALDLVVQKLELRLRVYKDPSGSERVYFDSLSQKVGGLKASRESKEGQWTVTIPGTGVFEGKINEDRTAVEGKWKQGIASLALKWTLSTEPIEERIATPSRPQMPKPPYPYLSEEVAFQNTRDNFSLAGTLTLPKSTEPVPAAILISGSGPQDRDESLLEHKPFLVLADHLTRNGIAVLRYDDRGTGKSKGIFDVATSADFAVDVESALEFLATDKRIDRKKIGLIGHSEGGLIAPMVAMRRPEIAFILLLAGPGVNGREIIRSQSKLIAQADGVRDEKILSQQEAIQDAIIETVLHAPQASTSDELLQGTLFKLKTTFSAEELGSDGLKNSVKDAIGKFSSPWFRYFLEYEPIPTLSKVKAPVLALIGEKDLQVDPKLNLPPLRKAIATGGHRLSKAEELPTLNHLFQRCKTGSVREYYEIEETMSKDALEFVQRWIREVVVSE